MLADTDAFHELIVELGVRLGFETTREESGSILPAPAGAEYAPRLDVMWWTQLSAEQKEAVAWATGMPAPEVGHLPVVGWEVEGTDVNTKVMTSDAVNLCASDCCLGVLAVNEEYVRSKKNERYIYARAARVLRSLRRMFGALPLIPMDVSWLQWLAERRYPSGVTKIEPGKRSKGAGGETPWAREARQRLREVGESAGFVVKEDFTPGTLKLAYQSIPAEVRSKMLEVADPRDGTTRPVRGARGLWTASKIDVVWILPLPRAVLSLVEAVGELDPSLQMLGGLPSEACEQRLVIGFELEDRPSKHAGGALINLAGHCLLGVAFTPDPGAEVHLQRYHATYAQAFPLQRVMVRALPT